MWLDAIATIHNIPPTKAQIGDLNDKPSMLSYEVFSQLILKTEKAKKRQRSVTTNHEVVITERILKALFQVALYKRGIEIIPFNARSAIP